MIATVLNRPTDPVGASPGDEPAEVPDPAPEDPAQKEDEGRAEPGLAPVPRGSVLEVFMVATRLGLTSFGGPIAHLAYFRDEYVVKRRWLDERTYADLVALCQFLPGAASSKLGMSIGILRAGLRGGLVAWLGFTLPSALALAVIAIFLRGAGGDAADLLHGLKVVAVAIVAQAVWGMARNLAPDRPRAAILIAATVGVFILPTAIGQIAVIAGAGLAGWLFLKSGPAAEGPRMEVPVPRWLGVAAWIVLFGLLFGLPVARTLVGSHALALFDSFYRSGALVFGGGHVVLPLLQSELVSPGWIDKSGFLAGYGLTQAVPGPLFTFSAYLGAAMTPDPNGALGAVIALVAIFLPSMLLTLGALPWWGVLRTRQSAQAALRGVNAAVVGILLAALYSPVWTSAILRPADFALALCAFGLLVVWRCPPWIVVLATGSVGALLAASS